MISYPPTTPPQPSTPATAPAGSLEAAKTSGRRYPMIFGIVFAVVTALALALAAIAPDLSQGASQSASAHWAPVYQRDLTTADTSAWDITHGCVFTGQGLDANSSTSDAAICTFMPAGAGGATTSGFYFEVKLAPASQISFNQRAQRALLLVGDSTSQTGNALAFEIDTQGRYLICDSDCSATSRSTYISSGTAAWHADDLVANTIAIEVSADHAHEIFYVNGQRIARVSVDMGAQPALAAGAPSGSEAVYTYATLTTGQ